MQLGTVELLVLVESQAPMVQREELVLQAAMEMMGLLDLLVQQEPRYVQQKKIITALCSRATI